MLDVWNNADQRKEPLLQWHPRYSVVMFNWQNTWQWKL